jgi:pimeloyl-ACP methyl ester carboxylesterase
MPGPLLTLLALLLLAAAGALCHWSLRIARGAERLVPATGRMVEVPGGVLHVVEAGDAEAQAVVLVHGLSGQLQHYTYAMADMLADEFRVIAVDRPGCGHSTRDSDALAAPAEQARMIWTALDRLGVRRPVLAGHSLGGTVVLAMALERPGDTGGLALLTPLTHPVAEPHPAFAGLRIRSPLMRRLLGYTLAVPLARRAAHETLDAVFAPDPWPEDFVTRGGGALGLRPRAYVTASGDLVAAEDGLGALAARYGELGLPGGVLLAAKDALLDPKEQGSPMAAHGFDIVTLPERGHMLPIVEPGICADTIRRVAARVQGAPA